MILVIQLPICLSGFGGWSLPRERGSTLAAENRPGWVFKAALWTVGSKWGGALDTKLHHLWIFKPTTWAAHSCNPPRLSLDPLYHDIVKYQRKTSTALRNYH